MVSLKKKIQLFLNRNHIWPTLFVKTIFLFQVEMKKNCYWNCQWDCFGPCTTHSTSWQYPLINYLLLLYDRTDFLRWWMKLMKGQSKNSSNQLVAQYKQQTNKNKPNHIWKFCLSIASRLVCRSNTQYSPLLCDRTDFLRCRMKCRSKNLSNRLVTQCTVQTTNKQEQT